MLNTSRSRETDSDATNHMISANGMCSADFFMRTVKTMIITLVLNAEEVYLHQNTGQSHNIRRDNKSFQMWQNSQIWE